MRWRIRCYGLGREKGVPLADLQRGRAGGAPAHERMLLTELGMEQGRGGREERLGVGVLWILEDLSRRALLHDLAVVHDDDAVGDVALRLDVVADEDHVCARTETSRADVGSSAMMTSGWSESARAMATRWRWPPES